MVDLKPPLVDFLVEPGYFLQPHSITKDKWSSLERYTTRIFTHGFCHDKHLTFKANSITTNGGVLRFRDHVNWYDGRLDSESDLRLWFPFDARTTLYGRLTNDVVKLHADFGVSKISDYRFNSYASFYMNRKGGDKRVAAGFKNISEHCHSDTRVDVDELKVMVVTYRKSGSVTARISATDRGTSASWESSICWMHPS